MTITATATAISTIVTHDRPHLDEGAGIAVLRSYGEKIFPGIRRAKIEIYDPEKHEDGRSEEAWLQDGYLFLGVRGGDFDDHPHEKFPHDCVFTLVLEALGLDNDPAWKEIARHVLTEDRHGASNQLHLAQLVKVLHQQNGVETVLKFIAFAISALYNDQCAFVEAQRIVDQPECLTPIWNSSKEREYFLCAVEGDNPNLSKAARGRNGVNALLVVQKNSKGQIYISSNKKLGMRNLDLLAAMLRRQEQEARELEPITDPCQLAADGMCQGWYHQKEAAALFCGSLTQPHLPGSSISFEEITRTAALFLERVQL